MTTLAPLRRARVLAGGLLAALAVTLLAPAASAHDVLIASDPAEGDTLSQSPAVITLTFNNDPLEVGSAVAVSDAAGETVLEVEGTASGPDVTFPVDSPLDSGDYEAHWRVASSDGHPIDGVIAFTVDAAEPGPTSTAEPAETGAEPGADATEENPAATETAEEEAPDAEPASGLSSLPLWLRVAIALAALAAVVGLVVRVVRRGRGDRV